jgi:hypothetical protein
MVAIFDEVLQDHEGSELDLTAVAATVEFIGLGIELIPVFDTDGTAIVVDLSGGVQSEAFAYSPHGKGPAYAPAERVRERKMNQALILKDSCLCKNFFTSFVMHNLPVHWKRRKML